MTRKITSRAVLQRIKRRIEVGLSMSYLDVLRDDPTLVKAALRFFPEGWKKAVGAARTVGRRGFKKKKPSESRRDEVIRLVKLRYSHGKSISLKDVRRDNYALLSLALRHFNNSWENAIEACGFSYETVRKRSPKPKPYWNKKLVIERIRQRAALGLALHIGAVRRDDEALYLAGMRHFEKSWKRVIEASGFSYDRVVQVRVPEYWTKTLIIKSIRARAHENLSLSYKDMMRQDGALLEAGCRYFKTWEKAVEASGIPYDSVLKLWRSERRIRHLKTFGQDRIQKN